MNHEVEMLNVVSRPIPAIVQQHVDDAAGLWVVRRNLVGAPHVRLHQLRRVDDRVAAHLDGVAVAGACGATLAAAALENPGPGAIFASTVQAIGARDPVALDKILAVAEAMPASHGGLVSGFGWVSASSLRGITKVLLESTACFRRQVGLAACAMHLVDAGNDLTAAFRDGHAELRVRALRVAGEAGRPIQLSACLDALNDEDARCTFEAARAALLLGDRRASVAVLERIQTEPGQFRLDSLALTLKWYTASAAHSVLRALSQEPASVRLLLRAIGIAGDPYYVPWLIQQMQDPRLTRLAGESFSSITGLDLAYLDLDRKPPENIETGPNDDPNDPNVDMDEDDGLPWPDAEKINVWWQANGHRFTPGTRYFMGEPPSLAHCLTVLKTGFQRQRQAAAQYLCLLRPGTPLFNAAAPAWRQQRWLNAMGS